MRLVGLRLFGLVVANGTQLRASNTIFHSGIAVVGDGRLKYELPAPLGRWIYAPGDDVQELTANEPGEFPFACAPGVNGSSAAIEAQNGPQCAGMCEAGTSCPAATAAPVPCKQGHFCPAGEPAAAAVPCRDVPCPGGTSA